MTDVTRILSQIEDGDPTAADRLLPLVYEELRNLAKAKLALEKPGQTLQATALVHDAYLRLVDADQAKHWDSRGHFFAAAAESMRRILVDNARRKASFRRGAGMHRRFLDEDKLAAPSDPDSLLDLNDALTELTTQDAQAAEIVKLRFFAGLTMDEAATVLGMSKRNAYYAWTYARSWLHKKLREM